MRVIDLYHICSHPLYYEVNGSKLIEGDAAKKLQLTIRSGSIVVGFKKIEDGLTAKYWSLTIKVYGHIIDV